MAPLEDFEALGRGPTLWPRMLARGAARANANANRFPDSPAKSSVCRFGGSPMRSSVCGYGGSPLRSLTRRCGAPSPERRNLDGCRFLVWRGCDWHPVPEVQAEQLRERIKAGERSFLIYDGILSWRIEADGDEGWTQVSLDTGMRRRIKVEGGARRGLSRLESSLRSAARRLGDAVFGSPVRKPVEPTARPPTRMPTQISDAGLVAALRREWHSMANGRDTMSRANLAAAWRTLNSGGRASAQESELLTQTAEDLFNKVDLGRNQRIEEVEWIHYRLLEIQAPSFHAMAEINEKLLAALAVDSSVLDKLLDLFESCLQDCGGTFSCCLSANAMRQAVSIWVADSVRRRRTLDSDCCLEPSTVGLEDNEELTYYDFMNHMLGRRKREVLLYLYDLSNGKASWLAPMLLGRDLAGVWHSSVVVHGKEFWYGGRILESVPGRTQFGQPTRVLHLGETMRTKDDLIGFIRRELLDEFTVQSYDVLLNNCNHFSNEVCRFLTNSQIPDEVLRQPEIVMDNLVFQAIKPMLNWSLGCFGDDDKVNVRCGGASGDLSMEQVRTLSEAWGGVEEGQLVVYEFEPGWTRLGRLLEQGQDTCTVEWYDYRVGCLEVQHSVPCSLIHPLEPKKGKTKRRPGGGGIFGACYHPVDTL